MRTDFTRVELEGWHPSNLIGSILEFQEAYVVQVKTIEANQETNQATIARLEEQLRTARRHHQEDIDKIGERLIQEAEEHEWCGQYDAVIHDLNRGLHVELPIREHEYAVTGTWTVTVPFTRYYTASDADAAVEMASDAEVSSSDIWEAVQNHRYDLDYQDEFIHGAERNDD